MSGRRRVIRIIVLELLGFATLASLFTVILSRQLPFNPVPPLVTAAATPTARPSTASTPGVLGTASLSTAVPTPTTTASPSPTVSPSPTASITATVKTSVAQLRLRSSPGTSGEIVAELRASTALTLIGRTRASDWLEVTTTDDRHGWVSAPYVDVAGDLALLPVTGTAVEAPTTAIRYLSGISNHARTVFLQGLSLGNHDYAFSTIGDSNTDNPAFLAPFDLGRYDLGPFGDLAPTVTYFAGSFSRDSAAAVGGFNTAKVLDPGQADGRCQGSESPLACEYRLQKPSVALILLGTGDQHTWQGFEGRYRQIVEYTLDQGIVPVLITKGDDLESRDNTATPGYINGVIRRLAVEYDVPLLDLAQAVAGLPNHGCGPDGFHYNSPPDGQTAVFDTAHLQYGFNMRNLTALQALDALRRYVLYSP